MNYTGCKSAAKRLPYLVRGSCGVLANNLRKLTPSLFESSTYHHFEFR